MTVGRVKITVELLALIGGIILTTAGWVWAASAAFTRLENAETAIQHVDRERADTDQEIKALRKENAECHQAIMQQLGQLQGGRK